MSKKKTTKKKKPAPFKVTAKNRKVNPNRENPYVQKLKCVLCAKILGAIGAHRHNPGPMICLKCLGKK